MTEQVETFTLAKLQQELDGELTAEMLPPADAVRPVNGAGLILIHPLGPTLGRRYAIRRDPVEIGRDPACQVHTPDESVSRKHARIELGPDGRYHVTDLG